MVENKIRQMTSGKVTAVKIKKEYSNGKIHFRRGNI